MSQMHVQTLVIIKEPWNGILEKFGYEELNARGEKLTNFCAANNLCITNSRKVAVNGPGSPLMETQGTKLTSYSLSTNGKAPFLMHVATLALTKDQITKWFSQT